MIASAGLFCTEICCDAVVLLSARVPGLVQEALAAKAETGRSSVEADYSNLFYLILGIIWTPA